MSTCTALALIFVLYSLTQAEGRAIAKLLEVAQRSRMVADQKGMILQARRLVGSAPPRCDRKCGGCPECEAILVPAPVPVPVTAQSQTSTIWDSKRNKSDDGFLQTSYARGDDISAYKPIMWKCKCGSLIFDP